MLRRYQAQDTYQTLLRHIPVNNGYNQNLNHMMMGVLPSYNACLRQEVVNPENTFRCSVNDLKNCRFTESSAELIQAVHATIVPFSSQKNAPFLVENQFTAFNNQRDKTVNNLCGITEVLKDYVKAAKEDFITGVPHYMWLTWAQPDVLRYLASSATDLDQSVRKTLARATLAMHDILQLTALVHIVQKTTVEFSLDRNRQYTARTLYHKTNTVPSAYSFGVEWLSALRQNNHLTSHFVGTRTHQ